MSDSRMRARAHMNNITDAYAHLYEYYNILIVIVCHSKLWRYDKAGFWECW